MKDMGGRAVKCVNSELICVALLIKPVIILPGKKPQTQIRKFENVRRWLFNLSLCRDNM